MTRWFTSDHHFGHENIISHCNRPFEDVHAMNVALTEAWNKVVAPGDDVYVLGDVSFSGLDATCAILDRLQGRKYLIAGNHDARYRKKEQFLRRFVWMKDLAELHVEDDRVPGGQQMIVMCHYPLLSWNGMARGAWMLHGHCHGRAPVAPQLQTTRWDVGVDCVAGYAPISYEAVKERVNWDG